MCKLKVYFTKLGLLLRQRQLSNKNDRNSKQCMVEMKKNQDLYTDYEYIVILIQKSEEWWLEKWSLLSDITCLSYLKAFRLRTITYIWHIGRCIILL